MMNWVDVNLVVETILDGFDFSKVDKSSKYQKEKLTDEVFKEVRNIQLKQNDRQERNKDT